MTLPFVKAIVILPGTALVYVPALILWFTRNTAFAARFPPESQFAWLTGGAAALAGLGLMAWTMRLFAREGGGGTPAPWQPVRNLIVIGPYRHVRNPMLIDVSLMLAAEAILLRSPPLFAWMIAFVALNTVYFAHFEEPELERRFGQAYVNYKRRVPRWLPRLTPYRAAGGDRRAGE